MSLLLKNSINQAHLENSIYKQIVTHLKKELELNGLEAHDELQVNTLNHCATNANTEKPKPTCHHCKNPGLYINHCHHLEKKKQQNESTKSNVGKFDSGTNNSDPNNSKKFKTVCSSCEVCGKTRHTTEKCYYGANAANMSLPWNAKPARHSGPQLTKAQNNITESVHAAV